VLAALSKCALSVRGCVLASRVNTEVSDETQIRGEHTVVGPSTCREQELEAHREAESELVRLE
jgi:hypothetical protein